MVRLEGVRGDIRPLEERLRSGGIDFRDRMRVIRMKARYREEGYEFLGYADKKYLPEAMDHYRSLGYELKTNPDALDPEGRPMRRHVAIYGKFTHPTL